MKRTYKTKRFTVTTELDVHTDCRWVRLFSNARDVAYCSSTLLLACASGRANNLELLKKARVLASEKLKLYKTQAQAILDIEL